MPNRIYSFVDCGCTSTAVPPGPCNAAAATPCAECTSSDWITQPSPASTEEGYDTTFHAQAQRAGGGGPRPGGGTIDPDEYRWQIFSGGSWVDLADGAHYSGTGTDTLTVINPRLSFDGNQYRCSARFDTEWVYSDGAELEVTTCTYVPGTDTGTDPREVSRDESIDFGFASPLRLAFTLKHEQTSGGIRLNCTALTVEWTGSPGPTILDSWVDTPYGVVRPGSPIPGASCAGNFNVNAKANLGVTTVGGGAESIASPCVSGAHYCP